LFEERENSSSEVIERSGAQGMVGREKMESLMVGCNSLLQILGDAKSKASMEGVREVAERSGWLEGRRSRA
jgi:hypothetical protein